MLLLSMGSMDMFGGSNDKPVVFKGSGTYNYLISETYWKDAFANYGGGFAYGNPIGGELKIDLTLARFRPPETPHYAWAFMEFTRRAHEFLSPKGIFNGYNFGFYTLDGTQQFGSIKTQVIPAGVTIGAFAGESPWFTYYSIGGGAGFVSEKWNLTTSIDSAKESGSTSATAWYGRGTIGLIRELKGNFGLDLSVSFDYLTFAHNKDEIIPGRSKGEQETIEAIRLNLGLDFAMPWIVERTVY